MEMHDEDQAGGGYTDADIEGRTPMGRFARPDDIARAVAFLAGPEWSGYVNGCWKLLSALDGITG